MECEIGHVRGAESTDSEPCRGSNLRQELGLGDTHAGVEHLAVYREAPELGPVLTRNLEQRFRSHHVRDWIGPSELGKNLDGCVHGPTQGVVHRCEGDLQIVVRCENFGVQIRERHPSAQQVELGGILELEPHLHLIELALA